MTKTLLRAGRQYICNLHAHSTVSDGSLTPSALVAAYRAAGYDAVAITDHEVLRDHSALSTPDFLVLRGYEISLSGTGDRERKPLCHITLLATPRSHDMVCFDPQRVWGNARSSIPFLTYRGGIWHGTYSVECVNELLTAAQEEG